jgi:hypothetical protein
VVKWRNAQELSINFGAVPKLTSKSRSKWTNYPGESPSKNVNYFIWLEPDLIVLLPERRVLHHLFYQFNGH